MRDPVVLLGARRAAVDAARRLDLEVVWLSEADESRRHREGVRSATGISFDDPARIREAALSLLAGRPAAAVVALSDRSVIAAAALRAALGVPGVGVETATLFRDKRAMKERLRAEGIPCATQRVVTGTTTADALIAELGLPVVLKPRDSSGSRGLVIARDAATLAQALKPGLLAESFVRGKEMSFETFLVEGAIRFRNPTEYVEHLWTSVLPAALAPSEFAALTALSAQVASAFGASRGLMHMEVFLTDQGIFFGEAALRPPGGRLMELLSRAYDFDAWEHYLRVELGDSPSFPARAVRTAGVKLIHPGAGIVEAVEGLERARRTPGIEEVVCTLRPGQRILPRVGSGEQRGHLLATGPNRDAVWSALQRAHGAIEIALRPDDGP